MAVKASDNFKVYENKKGPKISTVNRKIIEKVEKKETLYFKDIDGTGKVTKVNDWRLPAAERAAEYVKLLKLYQTSLDAEANHSLQLQEEKLKREMSGILNGSELNYQAKQYLKLVQAANLAGSFIVKIPLDNKQQIEEWKNTFIRLGYGNEFMKLVSNENVNIPGVLLKTGTVSSIETGVSFNVFKTILKEGLNNLESHSSTGLIPKDNKNKLLNMFLCVVSVLDISTTSAKPRQAFARKKVLVRDVYF
jgi:hypothetical protein